MTDSAELHSKSAPETKKPIQDDNLMETIKVVIQALVIAIVVRTLLFQPFNIPSGSLIPTLLIGDYLFVSKYSYGYSKFSIPFSPPVMSGRVWGSEPKRGDVAVFKLPRDGETEPTRRKCQSCWGTKRENVSTADRARAASDLAKYLRPQLKAVEVTGTEGGPIQHAHTIRFVE